MKWINDLVDCNGRYLPHLLPVDPTLHWANPPGGVAGRDSRPTFASTPGLYAGPVAIVTHLHGSHSTEESDGFTEAWYLPHATNIPAGYARVGSFYEEFRAKFQARWHQGWPPGTAVFQYQNDQRATTMWFHDHTLGMTRLNVYAGPAGFYLLRGGSSDLPEGVLPGPAPRLGDPPGTRYYELPSPSRTAAQRRRLPVLPGQPPVLRRLRRPLHPGQRYLADLQPGVLWQHHGGQRPHLAGPGG